MPGDLGGEGEIVVKMVLSAEEMESFLGVAGKLQAAGAGGQAPPTVVNVEKSIRASPTFLSIFKPLVALEAVKTGVKGLLQHSSIMNTYLGAMGKMFGAAVDLLLLPFTPLLNLLMLGMGKLLQWLVTSGILEKIAGYVETAITIATNLWDDVRAIWKAVTDFNIRDILLGAVDLVRDYIVDFVKHPIEVAALSIVAAIAALKFTSMAGGALGKLLGLGGAAGGGAAAVGGGILAPLALGGGLAAGGAAIMGKGAQVATENMLGILKGSGGSAMNVAKGTMAWNIFSPTGLTAAVATGGGAAAIKGLRGLFGGGGGMTDEQVAQQRETNMWLAKIAGSQGNLQQTVTINNPYPEAVARQVLEQARGQGMSATME